MIQADQVLEMRNIDMSIDYLSVMNQSVYVKIIMVQQTVYFN